MVPVSVLAIAFLWRKEIFSKRSQILIIIFSALLMLFLLYRNYFMSPVGMTQRAGEIFIGNNSPNILTTIGYFLTNYINHFSPQFLFQSGDFNLTQSTGVSSMMLTSFALPLVFGLAYFIKEFRKSKFAKFIIFSIIIFPLASSLTIIEKGAEATRSIQVVPFMAILVTVGFWQLANLLKDKYKLVLALIIGFAVIESGFFYYDYFYAYPARAADNYNYGLPEAFKAALSANHDYYYISKNVSGCEIDAAFFMHYDPSKYQNGGTVKNVVCINPEKIRNPRPDSVAIYAATDTINHFNNEKLIYSGLLS